MSAQPTSYYIASKAKAIAEQTAKARRALAEQFAKESPQWGLKPEEWEKRITCRTSECRSYVLEECVPLTSDPNLQAAGVEVCARTNVETSEVYTTLRPVHNEIVFRRPASPKEAEEIMKKVLVQQWERLSELQEHQSVGSPEYEGTTRAMREVDKTLKQLPPISPSFEEGKVACVHTAVGTLDSCELPSKEMVEKTFSTESRPVTLAPQEHFMALKSTVQGWTEMGWGAALRTRYEGRDPSEMPFGMNDLMHRQIIEALAKVAPKAVCDLLAGVFQEVEAFSPTERIERWSLYYARYFHTSNVLQECPELTEYLFELFVENPKYAPSIVTDLLNIGTLSPSLSAKLAADPDPHLRANIAGRPDTPVNVLVDLARDPDQNVRIKAAGNPHLPPLIMRGVLERQLALARKYWDNGEETQARFILGDIASDPKTPPWLAVRIWDAGMGAITAENAARLSVDTTTRMNDPDPVRAAFVSASYRRSQKLPPPIELFWEGMPSPFYARERVA
jgi:hypothetical protein